MTKINLPPCFGILMPAYADGEELKNSYSISVTVKMAINFTM